MKKIVFSVLAVAMCIAMMSSAFAYFTDVETSTGNTMQAGTMDIQIGDNNEDYRNGSVTATFTSPAGWAPGQTFETDPVYLKNTGTIPIRYIFGLIYNLVEADGTTADPESSLGEAMDIANHIRLVSYLEKSANAADFAEETFETANANAYLSYWSLAQDGSISLADLIAATPAGESQKTGLWFFDGGNDPANPPLPVGGVAQIKFKFELMPDTSNAYQGDIATFSMKFIAAQTNTNLDASITEYTIPVVP
jgi:predicted ribosomally synthesized peptide with SipW-like signal peptide